MSPRVRRACLSFGLALGSFVLAGVVGVACKKDPAQPIDLANEACCSRANEKMTRFAGCRIGGRCRSAEPIWLRGSIKCSAVEPRCMGGRCCEYIPLYGSPDAVLNWDDGEGDDDKDKDKVKDKGGEPAAEKDAPAEATTTTGGEASPPSEAAEAP